MKSEDIDNLDKASVMRLSISFLKVRTMMDLSEYLLRFLDQKMIEIIVWHVLTKHMNLFLSASSGGFLKQLNF